MENYIFRQKRNKYITYFIRNDRNYNKSSKPMENSLPILKTLPVAVDERINRSNKCEFVFCNFLLFNN